MSNAIKVVTGRVRFSYVHAFDAQVQPNGEKKYSVCLLIPKTETDTVAKLQDAITKLQADLRNELRLAPAAPLKSPLRDGDVEKPQDPNFAGCLFLNASSQSPVPCVDAGLQPCLSSQELYSGCWGRASVNLFTFNRNGNRGVGAGLNALQKLADGEPLAGNVVDAAAEFGGVPVAGAAIPAAGPADASHLPF